MTAYMCAGRLSSHPTPRGLLTAGTNFQCLFDVDEKQKKKKDARREAWYIKIET